MTSPIPPPNRSPSRGPVRALSFDVWDTLIIDDSDEPRRAARGLPTKTEARLQAFTTEVQAHHPFVSAEEAGSAWDQAERAFRHYWKVESYTPGLADRLAVAFRALGLSPTPGLPALIELLANMEVQIPPDPAPGVHAMLERLSKRYRLGIISDAIVTPGTGIRAILDGMGILHYFEVCIFSDEAGASKPSPLVFERAADGFGLPLSEIVHIGDREPNDVAGPQSVGARAVLYTGIIDRGSKATKADIVCAHHDILPNLLLSLD